jgi:TolA-binding protein
MRAHTHRDLAAALAVLALLVCGGAPQARGQATNEVEELKRQLRQLQENFERMQREQHQQIEALTKKLEDLTKQQAAEADKKKLEQELATELQKNQPPAAAPPPRQPHPPPGRRRSR